MKKAKKYSWLVTGGPWGGQKIMLGSEGDTFVFRLGDWHGRYFHGRWENV